MTSLSYMKKIIITALCSALCVILPLAFHVIPNAGNIFCPMQIPILLCGLLAGWYFGGLCGIIGPLLSSLLTSMPPVAVLPCMIAECITYGVLTDVIMKIVRTKKLYFNLYVSLIMTLIVGKSVAGILTALFFAPGDFSFTIWATSYFVIALPGIAIQLLLIPSLIVILYKTKAIPTRYH